AATVVQSLSAAQSARHGRSQSARERGHQNLLPPQPSEFSGAHPVLQTDARFSHRLHLARQLRPAAARRPGARRARLAKGGSTRVIDSVLSESDPSESKIKIKIKI